MKRNRSKFDHLPIAHLGEGINTKTRTLWPALKISLDISGHFLKKESFRDGELTSAHLHYSRQAKFLKTKLIFAFFYNYLKLIGFWVVNFFYFVYLDNSRFFIIFLVFYWH